MTDPSVSAQVQELTLDNCLELYEIDATPLGGDIYRCVASSLSDGPVTWQGNVYTPVPIEGSGWSTTGKGALPTPHLKVANIGLAFSAVAIAYDDLRGCKVTRHRTWKQFLDGQPNADPTAELPPDVYRVERKVAQNKLTVEWELAAQIDQQGALIPARVVLQDACTFIYRRFNGATGSFIYDAGANQCPFTGDTNGNLLYDVSGNSTSDPTLDRCSKRIDTGCKLRFPGLPLPTRAFPGVNRV